MVKKLEIYQQKRNLKSSHEPKALVKESEHEPIFVVQEHHARALHYDFRLESNGVLLSWAVPKGPPKTKEERRLAIQTEDHPLDYAHFAGTIPTGNYGAGLVKIWDSGTFTNLKTEPLDKCLEAGEIAINLHGKKLKGHYALVRTHLSNKESWIFLKMKN